MDTLSSTGQNRSTPEKRADLVTVIFKDKEPQSKAILDKGKGLALMNLSQALLEPFLIIPSINIKLLIFLVKNGTWFTLR